MEEIWKDIPNYKGYQVSDIGNVRTFNKITYTKKHGYRHWENRILKIKKNINKKNKRIDYRVDLWKDGKPKSFLVARLVAFTFYNMDIENEKLTVNHKDGNSLNNNINNLEIVSYRENNLHAFKNNLIKTQIKVKIIDKETGTIIYPSSLAEGNKLINKSHAYLSLKIKNNIFEDKKYKWELI